VAAGHGYYRRNKSNMKNPRKQVIKKHEWESHVYGKCIHCKVHRSLQEAYWNIGRRYIYRDVNGIILDKLPKCITSKIPADESTSNKDSSFNVF